MVQGTEQQQLDSTQRFFSTLESFEQKLFPAPELGLKRDAWLLVAIAIGFAISLVQFVAPLPTAYRFASTLAGLGLQVGALGAFAYRQLRDIIPDFIDARQKFAAELDRQFAARDEVLAWLRMMPQVVRQTRLLYIHARLESLRSRYALIFGAVDKLGFLPALVGVFLQIRAMGSLSLPSMIFGFFIVTLYAMSLWLTRYRLQLEAYSRLIHAADGTPASHPQSDGAAPYGVTR